MRAEDLSTQGGKCKAEVFFRWQLLSMRDHFLKLCEQLRRAHLRPISLKSAWIVPENAAPGKPAYGCSGLRSMRKLQDIGGTTNGDGGFRTS